MSEGLRRAAAAALSMALLVAQPVVFFRRVLINPRAHIPFDIEGFHLPLISYVAQCARRGTAPWWDPYPYCGVPIHADIQAQVFYPFTWVAILAGNHSQGRNLFYWVEWLVPLHMILAGLFAFWLLRRMGLVNPAALLGASVYQLGGYFASQAQHLGAISAAAWLPLAILAAFELRVGMRARWIAVLALAVAMSILAGFVAATLIVGGAVLLVAAALLVSREASWRTLPAVAAGFIGGAAIAAVELIPTWQLARASIASQRVTLGGGLPLPSLVSLVIPDYYHIFELGASYKLPYNFTEMYLYCGVATVILIALAPLVGKSRARMFLALTILSGFWMIGENTPVFRFAFRYLPGLVRGAYYADHALMAFCCFAGITAAMVLDRVGKRAPQAVLWSVALLTSYDLIHTGACRPMNSYEGGYKWEDSEYQVAGAPKVAEQLRELVNRTTPPSRLDYTDAVFTQGIRGADMLGLPTANGDSPFALRRTLSLRRLFCGGQYWERQLSVNRLESPLPGMMNVAWLAGVQELPADQVQKAGLEPAGSVHGIHLYRNPRVLPRFFLVPRVRRSRGEAETFQMLARASFNPAEEAIVEDIPEDRGGLATGDVKVKLYSANRLELEAESAGPAFLATSEPMYDGWEATVNGKPQRLLMTNGAFRGMALGAGTNLVAMEYHPRYLGLSILLSVVALVATAAGLGVRGEIVLSGGPDPGVRPTPGGH